MIGNSKTSEREVIQTTLDGRQERTELVEAIPNIEPKREAETGTEQPEPEGCYPIDRTSPLSTTSLDSTSKANHGETIHLHMRLVTADRFHEQLISLEQHLTGLTSTTS